MRQTFFISSLVCILASLHVVLFTLVVANWAPGLALRGPSGSMTRAFSAASGERAQIEGAFVLGLVAFAVQTVCAICIIDQKRGLTIHCSLAIGMTCAYALLAVVKFGFMHRR